jgi:hypothetical protein
LGERLAAHVSLTQAIPWALELRHGAARVHARLGGLSLTSLEIRGGASELDIELPRPTGTVPVALTGGASSVTFHCPQGVAYRVSLSGGASSLQLGTQSFGGIGGTLHQETPDYATATDRIELTVSGGASHLTVASGPLRKGSGPST